MQWEKKNVKRKRVHKREWGFRFERGREIKENKFN